jgi:hypothetical protein
VQDPKVLHLVKLILKVGGKKGVPQGGPFGGSRVYVVSTDRRRASAAGSSGGERNQAMVTRLHSPRTLSSPRSRN